MKIFLILLVAILFGPLWVLATGKIDFHADWRTANRNSAHLAPDPKQDHEAIIQLYAARAFNWRGMFSVHTWIAVKPKNATAYTVYQVVGWRIYYGLPSMMAETDIPDRYWFNHKPEIFYELRGDKAEALIPKIDAAARAYPYSGYELWPGPNSNTLPAYIARSVPELGMVIPPNAIGKDFVPLSQMVTRAPSNTGYQFSILGIFGVTFAKKEGLELNILGFVYGINPFEPSIALPGIGKIKFNHT